MPGLAVSCGLSAGCAALSVRDIAGSAGARRRCPRTGNRRVTGRWLLVSANTGEARNELLGNGGKQAPPSCFPRSGSSAPPVAPSGSAGGEARQDYSSQHPPRGPGNGRSCWDQRGTGDWERREQPGTGQGAPRAAGNGSARSSQGRDREHRGQPGIGTPGAAREGTGITGSGQGRAREHRGQPGTGAPGAAGAAWSAGARQLWPYVTPPERKAGFSMVKMVRHRELIAIILQQLDKFNPENQNVEDFLNESAVMLQTLKVTEEKFVLDTLAGCTEYKSLLDVVVDAFYAEDGRYCLIPERNLYIVICYLATFQLEELGFQHFSRIVKSLDTAKMQKFLRFFFNNLHLNTWIKDEWSHFYDSLYVKENLIDPLLRWQPKVQQLIEQLTNKLNNCATTVKTSKVTQPKEFNLTVPKPRAIPPPQPIPRPVLEKRRPVPPSTYKPPKEIKQLEEIKEKNFQKASDLLLKANTDRFRCATMKPEKRESTHDSMKIKPAFRAQKIQSKIDNIPIKLNTAAILREGALYQKKMEEELKRVENLEQGFGDPSEFLEWQKQMRGKDLEEQLAEIECRRLQGKLSHEEAVLARQNVIQENKKKADILREEKAELMHQHAEKRLQEQREMKELAEQVMEGHKNVKQVKTKLQEYKQQIAQQVSEESEELLRQALKEEEEKAKKRYELIQQIRALESIPGIRHKFVDLTETGGHGLFCEMSIVELRERLALLKEAQKAAEEEKRDQIIHEKQAKEQLILEKLDQISQFRAELGRAAAFKQEEKKRKSQSDERPMKDERILNLQRKIVEKKMERKKQAGLLKIIPQKTSIMPSKDSSQGDHWRELEEIRERQFKLLQRGFMAREAAQKRAACVAARIGTTTYILRSDIQ